MPSLKDSLGRPDPTRYQPKARAVGPTATTPPDMPSYMQQSAVMISSLPNISTNASDSMLRQFYTGSGIPTRRLILPN